MADPIALGVALTADSSDFERGVASSEAAWTKLNGTFGTFSSTAATISGAFAKIGADAPAEFAKVTAAADGAAVGFGRAQGALQELGTSAPRLASLAFGPVGIAIALAAAVGMAAWSVFKDDTFEIFGEVAGEAVTLSEAVGAAWQVAKDLAGEALKGIGEFAKELFGKLGEWWDAMPDDAFDALGYLWDGFKSIWTKIGDFAKLTFEALVGLANAAVQGMIAALPALWEAYKNVFTQIGKLGAAAWEALKSGSTEPLMAQLRESGRSMVTALGNVGRAGSAAFVAALPPAFDKLKTIAGEAIGKVRKLWADAVVGIREGTTTNADGKPGAGASGAAGKAAADELIRQQQALQDALTNLERAGIAARLALQTDALDRELRELQSMFTLRKISEEQYINDSTRLQQQKTQETINGLSQERDAVATSIDRLVAQYTRLEAAGDAKGALKTQQAIANALKSQLELSTKIEVSARELESIDKDRLARLEALAQKQADADAAALDMITQYRVKLAEAGQQRQFEIGLIGKTREQQEILRATHAAEVELQKLMNELRRIEVQITAELMREEGARPDVLRDLYRAQNVLFQEAADARTEISRVEVDARNKLNAESADKLEKGLADALVNGLMSGKGVANSLRDYFKQVLGDDLKKIITQALSGVGGLLSQILGGGGGGGGILSSLLGGGGGGGGGGIISSIFGGDGGSGSGIVGTILSALGGVFSSVGPTVLGWAGSLFGGTFAALSTNVSALMSAGTTFGSALTQAAGVAGGLSTTLASAIPIVGWAYAAYTVGSGLYDSGWRGDNRAATNLHGGTTGGQAFGNFGKPGNDFGAMEQWSDKFFRAIGFNNKWASILSGSGIAARAFGFKTPEATGGGIEGTVSSRGLQGQQYIDWKQKGGWFRSDRSGTDHAALDASFNDAFNAQIQAMSATFASLGKAIGVGGDLLNDFSASFKLSLYKLTDKEQQAALVTALKTISDQMTGAFVDKLRDSATAATSTIAGYIPEIVGLADAFRAGHTGKDTEGDYTEYVNMLFGVGAALKAMTDAIPELTLSIAGWLGATDEQRGALTTLGDLYKLEGSDYVQFTRDALAAGKRSLAEALRDQNSASAAIAALQDGSLAKAQQLAAAESQRLQMFANLMQLIDQVGTELHAMFTSSAESFRLAGMTESEKYNYFDGKANDVYQKLQTATDPTQIRDLAAQLNAYLNSAFALLSPEEKLAKGGDFAVKAEAADKIAQKQLAEAQAKAELEAKTFSATIQSAITTAMQKVAADMQTAVDKLAVVAATPTTVVVTGKVTVELDYNGSIDTVDVGIAGVQRGGSY